MIPHHRSTLEAFVLAAAAGLVLGLPLLSAAAAFLLVLGLAADAMARRAYAGVEVTHALSRSAVPIDDEVEVWLGVANPERWPMPAVHFEDVVPAGLEVARPAPRGIQRVFHHSVVWDAFHVGPQERVRHHLRVTARHRGRWVLGPARVWSRDPLGWSLFERHAAQQPVLTVYPRLYPVPTGLLTPSRPEGDRRGPPWQPPDPLRVVGVRPYEPGDPPRLIHPHATARTGVLQVKRLEPGGDSQVALLALAATGAPKDAPDPDLFEALVSAAASVADQYLDAGAALGFSLVGAVYGRPRGVHLPPARGPTQWARVMTALAWVSPGGGDDADVKPAVGRLSRQLKPGDHLVCVTSFRPPSWTAAMRQLVQRGVQVTNVRVGPACGAPDASGVRVRAWTPAPVAP